MRCETKRPAGADNSKTQNAFLFAVLAIFGHDYPLAVEPASTPRPLVQNKTLRDSVPIDMLLSAVYVLVVAQSSSEVPEALINNPVLTKPLLNKGLLYTVFLAHNMSQGILFFITTRHTFRVSCVGLWRDKIS